MYFGPNGKIKKYCWLRAICVAWRKTCGKAKKFLLFFFCKYFRLNFSAFSLVFFVGILKWACVCMCESVTMMCWQQQQQHTEWASCCCWHRWTYLLRGHIVGARTQIDACIRVDAGQDEEDTCRRICIKNIYIYVEHRGIYWCQLRTLQTFIQRCQFRLLVLQFLSHCACPAPLEFGVSVANLEQVQQLTQILVTSARATLEFA